jgi:uncharacterized protein YecE (DUF72 family)
MTGPCYIGCSGWNYKHWAAGRFYPKGLAQRKWLEYYGANFNTVEINNSFYRIPLPDTMTKWADTVPPAFRFAVKIWRGISHYRKLSDIGEFLRHFLDFADRLAPPRRGPLLLQLPPNMGKNLARLEAFLVEFQSATRASPWLLTVEFRNTEWLTDDVYRLLDAHKAAIALVDGRCPATEPNDVDFVYVRRHYGPDGGNYARKDIAEDAKRVKSWRRAGKAVYVYYNNDLEGYAIVNARELMKLVGLKPPKPPAPEHEQGTLYD